MLCLRPLPKAGKVKMTERNCKATLYVETPDIMIPKKLKKDIMPRDPEELGTAVGHVFFGLTDEKGREKTYGLHACCALYGAENVAPGDRMEFFSLKKVAGVVTEETKEPYDEKLVYHITRSQYDAVRKYAETAVEKPPKYNIWTSNCVIFAYKALKQADLKLPPQLLPYSPAMVTVGVRVLERAAKLKDGLREAGRKLSAVFSSDRKISLSALEKMKSSKKMEGFGVRSLVAEAKRKAR